MRIRRKHLAAAAAVAAMGGLAVIFHSSSGGSIDVLIGSTPAPPTTISCDVNTTAASLTALNTAVTAATTGQTVCLAQAGAYGTWTGVNKTVTIAPTPGIAATMGLNLGGNVHNFTINGGKTGAFTDAGLTITSFDTILSTDNATNFTIKNAEFGSNAVHLDTITSAGVTLDHDHWHDILGSPPADPAGVWVDNTSNVTVKNSLLENMTADGLNLSGSSITATGNDFNDIYPHGDVSLHVDGIQWIGGIPSSVISGNYVYGNCEQGLSGFDGSGSMTYEDNVIVGCTAWAGEFGGDRPGSQVDHNTIKGTGDLGCGSKANGVGSPNGPSLTFLHDNFVFGGGVIDTSGLSGGPACTPTQNLNNLTSTPTFTGGSTPTTYAGFALASGSTGKGTASDAGDVGARVDSYPRATGMP